MVFLLPLLKELMFNLRLCDNLSVTLQ